LVYKLKISMGELMGHTIVRGRKCHKKVQISWEARIQARLDKYGVYWDQSDV